MTSFLWATGPQDRCGEHDDFGVECDRLRDHILGQHAAKGPNGLVRYSWTAGPRPSYDVQQDLHRTKMVQVVAKALLYEAAWNRYCNPSVLAPLETEDELILKKAHAHQELLDAVRLLRVPDPPPEEKS